MHGSIGRTQGAWPHIQGRQGIGLTLAIEVARCHGGNIEIEPGQVSGCVVRLSIPVETDAALLRERKSEVRLS